MKIEADDGIDAVIKNEFAPFCHDERFIGFAARGTFVFDFARRPSNQPGVTANRRETEPVQGQAEMPRSLGRGQAEVVTQDENKRAVGHPGFQVKLELRSKAGTAKRGT